jgi:hypothetical protein
MARITIGDQYVPSAFLKRYKTALGEQKLIRNGKYIVKRHKFRMPKYLGNPAYMKSFSGQYNMYKKAVSFGQRITRAKFAKCVKCFNIQQITGGAEPPEVGVRSREWWYNEAAGSGLFYYDYFIQQTMLAFKAGGRVDWCPDLYLENALSLEDQPDLEAWGYAWNYLQTTTDGHTSRIEYRLMPDLNTLHFCITSQGGNAGLGKCILSFYKSDIPWLINEDGVSYSTWNFNTLGEKFNEFWFDIDLEKEQQWVSMIVPECWAVQVMITTPPPIDHDHYPVMVIAGIDNEDILLQPYWTYTKPED